MNNKLHNLIDIFDIGDLSFFILLAKKKYKKSYIFYVFDIICCFVYFAKSRKTILK